MSVIAVTARLCSALRSENAESRAENAELRRRLAQVFLELFEAAVVGQSVP